MYILGMIVLSFFALIGAGCFLSALMRSGADQETALLLDNLISDNAEFRIRRAARLCDRIRCDRLICRCADEEAEQICTMLMKEYRIIEIQQKPS